MKDRLVVPVTLCAAILVCGCGSTEPQILQIGGNWQFSNQVSSSTAIISCSSSGTAALTQTGSNFTGIINATQGICTDSFGNTTDNTGVEQVSGGQVNGTSVSFQVPFCQASGTISGDPPNQMSGTESCTLAIEGRSFQFTGTWQASR